jgi:hypothetical protein
MTDKEKGMQDIQVKETAGFTQSKNANENKPAKAKIAVFYSILAVDITFRGQVLRPYDNRIIPLAVDFPPVIDGDILHALPIGEFLIEPAFDFSQKSSLNSFFGVIFPFEEFMLVIVSPL